MLRLMADANVEGHLWAVVLICRREPWRLFWEAANVTVHTFKEFGLAGDMPDSQLWQFCQEKGILLFTGNRNEDGVDSLEVTVRERSTALSLPVLTVHDADRIVRDRAYAERVAIRLLEVFDDIELLRGTGRVYLP